MTFTRKKSPRLKANSCKEFDTSKTNNRHASSSYDKDSLPFSCTAPSRSNKIIFVPPSSASKNSLDPQTEPPSRFPLHYETALREIELSRTHHRDLESLLTRGPFLAPKIKEALRQISS